MDAFATAAYVEARIAFRDRPDTRLRVIDAEPTERASVIVQAMTEVPVALEVVNGVAVLSDRPEVIVTRIRFMCRDDRLMLQRRATSLRVRHGAVVGLARIVQAFKRMDRQFATTQRQRAQLEGRLRRELDVRPPR